MPAVIATRTIDLAGPVEAQVQISILQPEPDGDDYRCEFEITGLGKRTIRSYAMGVDSTQALVLALRMVGTRLYTSSEGKAGRLSWLGLKDLGFSVDNKIAYLVPKDPVPIGVLFDFRFAPGKWLRTVNCEDWPSARDIAVSVASRNNAAWIEIHAHSGRSETWRNVEGKWEQASG